LNKRIKLKKKEKFYKRGKKKKLKIKRIRIKLKNIIYDKLGLKDKIEKKIFIKGPRINKKKRTKFEISITKMTKLSF
jgi:hypothetical protein